MASRQLPAHSDASLPPCFGCWPKTAQSRQTICQLVERLCVPLSHCLSQCATRVGSVQQFKCLVGAIIKLFKCWQHFWHLALLNLAAAATTAIAATTATSTTTTAATTTTTKTNNNRTTPTIIVSRNLHLCRIICNGNSHCCCCSIVLAFGHLPKRGPKKNNNKKANNLSVGVFPAQLDKWLHFAALARTGRDRQ